MLLGRSAELDRLDGLLAALDRGLGFALVLAGGIGAGKSALLDAVAGRSGAGQVLRAYGTRSESEVAFCGLSELAQPLLDDLAALPARQRNTLRSVLALSDTAAHGTLAVFVAVTSLLAAGAESRSRLCLIDDAQWLDAASASALLFAARRLTERPVGFIFAVRARVPSAFDASWLPTLEISPLDGADARDLVRATAPDLAAATRGSVVAAAEGNPLALVEFARMAGAPWGGEQLWSAGPLRVSERLERALGAEAAALPAATKQALVVLAAAEAARLEIMSAAIAAVTGSPAALDPAVDCGLAVIRGDRVVFRHPLVRSAVYQSAPAASVRAAHAALAGALAGAEPERAAWHRALAAPAPDEQVAAGLERTAALARRRGGHVAEARALERAARLSPDAGTGTARLLAAGTAALVAGQPAWARSLLDEVTARTDDPLVLADAEHELAQLAFWREGRRSPSLQVAARRVEPADPARAARLYSLELSGLITDYRVSAALPVAERAWELVGHGVEPFEVSFRVAHVLVMAGRTAAAAALVDRAAAAVSAAGNTTAMIMISQPLWWLERYETARDLLDGATAELRTSGGLWMLVHALVARAELERRVGRLAAAYSAAAEALALAEQLGEPMQQTEALYELAAAEAVLGREVEARAHADRALRVVADRAFGVAEIRVATAAGLGGAALAADRPAEAVQRLAPAVELVLAGGVADPALIPCIADLIEAHAACGSGDAAAPLADWLAAGAEHCGRRWARLAAVRCRALLGTAGLDELQHALGDDDGAARLETARGWLVLGTGLRRGGSRKEAGAALRRANDIFEYAGAGRWAARAAAELRACGEKAPVSAGAPVTRLTPRETRVAMLVARGARSRDVANALFLSERTVESHLAAVYRKLGVRSRTELAVHLAGPARIGGEIQSLPGGGRLARGLTSPLSRISRRTGRRAAPTPVRWAFPAQVLPVNQEGTMQLNSRRIRSLATLVTGTALVAAMAGGAGAAAASARPAAHHAAHLAASTAPAAARAAASGTEHFQLMTTSATSTKSTIIASGVFTAGGVDHAGNRTDKVVFPGGTFKIRHSNGQGKQSFNPRTCLMTIKLHGTYKLKSGTGTYAGIRGHGRYRLSILAIAARNANGKCSQRKAPVSWEQIIKARGPVHV